MPAQALGLVWYKSRCKNNGQYFLGIINHHLLTYHFLLLTNFTSCFSQGKSSCFSGNSFQLFFIFKAMKVEIWSDIMCPFCYIGKRKFEAALSQVDFRDNIEVEWKSFLLNPDIVTDPSKSTVEYLAEVKNMSVEHAKQMTDQVAQMAAQSGLEFDYDKTVVANTRNAHRLIQMAKAHLLGDQAEEILFNAYFKEGKNMDDKDTLVELGQKIGLDGEEVRKMLDSDQFDDKVRQEIFEAQQIGVRGVPFFVIDNKFAISGAQPENVFIDALNKAFGEKDGASV